MKKLTIIITLFLLCGEVYAQGWLKMAGKISTDTVWTNDGQMIMAGTKMELDKGTTPEGNFKHIYTQIGGLTAPPSPLGYGADYETIEVDHIRKNKNGDYIVFVKVMNLPKPLYVIEVDKAIKSGEVVRVFNE